MVDVSAEVLRAAVLHASEEAPKESCGLVVEVDGKDIYVPCRNMATGNIEFAIHTDDFEAAEDRGEVKMIVHSHYGIPPEPTHADLVSCEKHGLPWLIVNWPVGTHKVIEPSGYVAPLLKRQFCHGVLDCYTLVKDYYERVLGVTLPDPDREDEWWTKGLNLYLDNAEANGFMRVPDKEIREHDVVLMQIRSDVPNHAAVYVGNSRIIHHLSGRLSCEDVYGGYWLRSTYGVYRHRSQA